MPCIATTTLRSRPSPAAVPMNRARCLRTSRSARFTVPPSAARRGRVAAAPGAASTASPSASPSSTSTWSSPVRPNRRTDQRDSAAAIGVHEGTLGVVVDHADGTSQGIGLAAPTSTRTSARWPMATRRSSRSGVTSTSSSWVCRSASHEIRLTRPGHGRRRARKEDRGGLIRGEQRQHRLVHRGVDVHAARVDDAQHGRADGDRVSGLAQPARHQPIEGRQQRGAHHGDPSLLGAACRDVDAAGRLRTLSQNAIELGASHAEAVARLVALLARNRPRVEQRERPRASRSAVASSARARSSSAASALQRGARRTDAGLRGAQVRFGLVRLEARELLAEGDAGAFIDEHLAEPAHEVEPHRGFALALDGPASERFLRDGAAVDPNDLHADGRPDPEPRDEQHDRDEHDDPQAAAHDAERSTEDGGGSRSRTLSERRSASRLPNTARASASRCRAFEGASASICTVPITMGASVSAGRSVRSTPARWPSRTHVSTNARVFCTHAARRAELLSGSASRNCSDRTSRRMPS
jgi:hypothetical protein